MKEGEVQLGSWFPCSSPQGLHGIPYGNWVFEVQGEDEAGNESKEPAAHKWMTFFEPDTMYVRTIVRPQAIVSSPSFGFQVQAVRGNLNAPPSLLDTPLECSLQVQQDQEPFEPDWQECTSNITYEGVGDGTYQFQVILKLCLVSKLFAACSTRDAGLQVFTLSHSYQSLSMDSHTSC